MGEKGTSAKLVEHKIRICKLRKDGKLDEVDKHELNPIVYCNKCNAKSDDPSYICNPRTLKAPKIAKIK
jgi:hypothetical protein